MTSWITIDPVKVELNKSLEQTGDDAALGQKVDAACAEIERRIGHVNPLDLVETYDVDCSGQVILNETPVMAVTDVQLLAADGTVLTDYGSSDDADPSGVLYGLPYGTVQISYTAGLDPIPDDIVEATVQLATHLWRQSRSLTEGGRIKSDVPMGPGMSSALPNRVAQLLGLTGKSSRSRVFVG